MKVCNEDSELVDKKNSTFKNVFSKGDGNDGKPDALRKSEIMIRGWSTPQCSEMYGNCIFVDGLGAF